ncbi:MAG: D-alanine--D-alanine ligase [Planctomycetia bacterium]|nr:D-alanine--D-alanine ligase [Planctomycetia bacterium]
MRIGLTYDLRPVYLAEGFSEEETAEFDRPDTIDAIQRALRELGHETDRIGHARQLVERLARGDRWDLVFNIAEGLRGIGREAQVPAILDVYGVPYTFSDPLVLALALHKGLTKVVVQQAGIRTADFAVVRTAAELDRVELPLPLFVKPAAEGTGKGISGASKIVDRAVLARLGRELLARYRQPVLIERYLPGREFTVGLVGTGERSRVLGTLEIVLRGAAEAGVYSYANKEQCEELVEYVLVRPDDPVVADSERLALSAWRALDCRDAGRIDLRCDESGRPCFLEANPLAGLHPEHSDLPLLCTRLAIAYKTLIEWIVESASERVAATRRVP